MAKCHLRSCSGVPVELDALKSLLQPVRNVDCSLNTTKLDLPEKKLACYTVGWHFYLLGEARWYWDVCKQDGEEKTTLTACICNTLLVNWPGETWGQKYPGRFSACSGKKRNKC